MMSLSIKPLCPPLLSVSGLLFTPDAFDQLQTLSGQRRTRVMRALCMAETRYAGSFFSNDHKSGCCVVAIEFGIRVFAYIEINYFVILGFEFADPPFTGAPLERVLMVQRIDGKLMVIDGGGSGTTMIRVMPLPNGVNLSQIAACFGKQEALKIIATTIAALLTNFPILPSTMVYGDAVTNTDGVLVAGMRPTNCVDAMPAGGDQAVADSRRQVRPSSARGAEQDQVIALIQPAVGGDRGHDLRFGGHRRGLEVEAGEGLARWQASFGEMTFDAAPGALGHQGRQEARGRPTFPFGSFDETWPDVVDGWQTQNIEHDRETADVDTVRAEGITRDAGAEGSPGHAAYPWKGRGHRHVVVTEWCQQHHDVGQAGEVGCEMITQNGHTRHPAGVEVSLEEQGELGFAAALMGKSQGVNGEPTP